MVDRRFRGAIVTSVGTATMGVGTFLPWLRSGARNRSSYTIFDLVERLGFASGGMVALSLRLWPLVPLLLVACTIGAWAVVSGRLALRAQIVLVALVSLWVAGTAASLFLAPDAGLFRIGPGPAVTLLGVVPVVAGSVLLRRPGSGSSATS